MSFCDDAREAGLQKIEAAYKPFIDETSTIIKNMNDKGLDPTKFYDAKNNEIINLVSMLSDLLEAKRKSGDDVNSEVEKNCEQAVGYIQKVVDLAVLGYTFGISEVLPKHMTHIDVGVILSGKPLGGDNSVFNEIKNQAFDLVKVGADSPLRKALNNPIESFKNELNNILRSLGFPGQL